MCKTDFDGVQTDFGVEGVQIDCVVQSFETDFGVQGVETDLGVGGVQPSIVACVQAFPASCWTSESSANIWDSNVEEWICGRSTDPTLLSVSPFVGSVVRATASPLPSENVDLRTGNFVGRRRDLCPGRFLSEPSLFHDTS